MGEVIRLIAKSELERARLIREARAIYDSIFPRAGPVDKIAEDGESENAEADGEGGSTGEPVTD